MKRPEENDKSGGTENRFLVASGWGRLGGSGGESADRHGVFPSGDENVLHPDWGVNFMGTCIYQISSLSTLKIYAFHHM